MLTTTELGELEDALIAMWAGDQLCPSMLLDWRTIPGWVVGVSRETGSGDPCLHIWSWAHLEAWYRRAKAFMAEWARGEEEGTGGGDEWSLAGAMWETEGDDADATA